jgi:alpha/beta superfamily hydrolase
MIAVGFPTIYRDRTYLNGCTVPRFFIQSTRDQFGPVEEIEPLVASLPEPKRLILIDSADHFFADGLEKLEEAVAGLTGDAGQP